MFDINIFSLDNNDHRNHYQLVLCVYENIWISIVHMWKSLSLALEIAHTKNETFSPRLSSTRNNDGEASWTNMIMLSVMLSRTSFSFHNKHEMRKWEILADKAARLHVLIHNETGDFHGSRFLLPFTRAKKIFIE